MSQHLPSSIYFPRIHQMSHFLRFSLFKEKIYLEVDYYSPYQPLFETVFFPLMMVLLIAQAHIHTVLES